MFKFQIFLSVQAYLKSSGCRSVSRHNFLNSRIAPGIRKQKGQSLLEMAFFLPVLFILLLALIYIGFCLDNKMKMEAIAREATRAVAKNTGNGSVSIGLTRAEAVARQYGLNPENMEIKIYGTYVSDNFTPGRGSTVTAEVNNNFKLFGFVTIHIAGKNSEIIECWRTRDDANSGGTCMPPDEQAE